MDAKNQPNLGCEVTELEDDSGYKLKIYDGEGCGVFEFRKHSDPECDPCYYVTDENGNDVCEIRFESFANFETYNSQNSLIEETANSLNLKRGAMFVRFVNKCGFPLKKVKALNMDLTPTGDGDVVEAWAFVETNKDGVPQVRLSVHSGELAVGKDQNEFIYLKKGMHVGVTEEGGLEIYDMGDDPEPPVDQPEESADTTDTNDADGHAELEPPQSGLCLINIGVRHNAGDVPSGAFYTALVVGLISSKLLHCLNKKS